MDRTHPREGHSAPGEYGGRLFTTGVRAGLPRFPSDPTAIPAAVVIAIGSEVSLAVAAAEQLDSEGVGVRVVSLPCWELFGAQDADYRDSVLPTGVPRVAVEAGATLGWERYVGDGPVVGVDRFGASAPGDELARRLGLTEEAVCDAVRSVVER